MPPSDERTRKLYGILAQENSKTGAYQRTPAIFRETWNDTHKKAPIEDWGPSPSLAPPGFQPFIPGTMPRARHSATTMGSRKAGRGAGDMRRSQSATGSRPVEFRSVFQPRPEQRHVCDLAKTRRENVKGNEWALLDTLEAKMYADERAQRWKIQAKLQEANRRQLDGQLQEHEAARQQELRDAKREGELISEQVAAFKADEQRKAQELMERNRKLKQEQTVMLQATRDAKQRALDAKKASELAELARIQAQLDEEKRAAADRMEAARLAMARTTLENELRLKARKEADAAQSRREEEIIQAGMREQERKEREREEGVRALYEKAQRRANHAGAQVVAERKDREEREQRLIQEAYEKKEREVAERARLEREKREKQKAELLNARAEYIMLRDQRAAAERAETLRLRQEMEEKEAREREEEERKLALIRDRANRNRSFLTTQIIDKEAQSLNDDVGMSERERYLNLQLLETAVKVVGPTPKQLPYQW